MRVSIIIPTFNRKQFLREALAALSAQTYSREQFEVIVVDDGSDDGTADSLETYPFALKYFRQSNQGDAAARNLGARNSQADLLIFLDDDVLVAPDYVSNLVELQQTSDKLIAVGTEHLWLDSNNPLKDEAVLPAPHLGSLDTVPHNFADVCSNNMSIRRIDYLEIGGMEGLDFPGSDIWCDVDFAYRAYLKGYQFKRSLSAICFHRDYVAGSLSATKKRMYHAAYRSVELFKKYPELSQHLPMFDDKLPIHWQTDSPLLVGRKIVRRAMASSLPLFVLERAASLMEQKMSDSSFFEMLKRWVVGEYIYRGYRAGLREINGK